MPGTPSGVGETVPGDRIHAALQLPGSKSPLAELKLQVSQREAGYQFKA